MSDGCDELTIGACFGRSLYACLHCSAHRDHTMTIGNKNHARSDFTGLPCWQVMRELSDDLDWRPK